MPSLKLGLPQQKMRELPLTCPQKQAGEGGAKHIRPGLPPAFVRESTRTKRTGWNEKRRKERENISSSVRVVIVLQVMYVCPSELTTDVRINMPENSQAGRSFVVCILGSVVIDRNPSHAVALAPPHPLSLRRLLALFFSCPFMPFSVRPSRGPFSLPLLSAFATPVHLSFVSVNMLGPHWCDSFIYIGQISGTALYTRLHFPIYKKHYKSAHRY